MTADFHFTPVVIEKVPDFWDIYGDSGIQEPKAPNLTARRKFKAIEELDAIDTLRNYDRTRGGFEDG